MERNSSQTRFLYAAGLLTAVYLSAVFLVLPLIFTNYYFNITETKQTFFLIASGVYPLLLLFARILCPPDFGVPRPRAALHPAAFALMAFFVVSVVGALLSRYPDEAFFGENNRYQGLLTIFTYAFVVTTLSLRTVDLKWPIRAFVLAAALVSLLGLFNHFGVDPLGFYTHLRAEDQGRFLSTLGNADFYGAYLVMAYCVTFGFFLRAASRFAVALATVALVVVSFGALVAGSDSAALGLLACAAIYPLLLFRNSVAMRRYFLGWCLFLVSAFTFGLLSRWLPSKTYLSFFTGALANPFVSLPLAAVSAALWFFVRRIRAERLLSLRRPYGVALAAAGAFVLLALVLLNTALREIPLGGLSRYLRFSASWGTDRGKIWSFVLRFYHSLPLGQKLFGAGSGALFHADAVRPLFSDASLDTAHNEYLQYLVTNGALGLGFYLFALASAVRSGVRRCADDHAFCGITVAVLAYAVQAAVNIAQPASTPLFFVLLAVLVSRAKTEPSTD